MRGPLLSFSAAGTVAGTLQYSTQRGQPIARAQRLPAGTNKPGRAQPRASVRAAAVGWRTLDEDTRTIWKTLATRLQLPPFACYLQEYMRQRIQPEDQPLIPA